MRKRDESEKDSHDTASPHEPSSGCSLNKIICFLWFKYHCRKYYNFLQSEWFSGARKFPM